MASPMLWKAKKIRNLSLKYTFHLTTRKSCGNMWNILFGYAYTTTFNAAKEGVSALKLDCLQRQTAGTDSSTVLAHAN